MTQGLYIQVSSPDRVSTFIIQFLGRTKNQPIQLNQHIYDFTRIVKEQKAFFKVKKFGTMKKEDTADLSFTFTMIPVTGRVAVTFRACKKSQILCLGDNFTQISEPLESFSGSIGQKETYNVVLPHSLFTSVNPVEQSLIIIVLLSNTNTEGDSYCAFEYSIGNLP